MSDFDARAAKAIPAEVRKDEKDVYIIYINYTSICTYWFDDSIPPKKHPQVLLLFLEVLMFKCLVANNHTALCTKTSL